MRWIFTALLFGSLTPAFAQTEFIEGQVNSGSYLGPINKVHVRMGKYSTKTEYDGKFSLRFTENEPLILSHSNYHTQKVSLSNMQAMEHSTYYLTPTTGMASMIIESEASEKVYDPEFEHVFDFTFLNDTLIILSYMNLHKAQQANTKPYVNCTLTAMRHGKMIGRKVMPNFVERLFVHPSGQLYFECQDSSYILNKNLPTFSLEGVDYKNFKNFTSLVYAENDKFIFYAYQYSFIPQVAHKFYSLSTNEVYLLELIQNPLYFDKVADDYAMLSQSQIEDAKEMEKDTGINHKLFSTFLRSFSMVRDITPPYAPGFKVNDTIILFDNLSNKASYYDRNGKLVRTINMYHNNLQREKLINMIQDPFTQVVYTLHDKGGVQFLREVNTQTASTGRPFKLKYPFAENVKVFENYVYYLHKSARDTKLNHLVREKIPFTNKDTPAKGDLYYYSE